MEIRLPPDQEARLALAASTGRSTGEMLEEAIAQWEARQAERLVPRSRLTPAQAVARIRELRKGAILPPDQTIKDLINHGRRDVRSGQLRRDAMVFRERDSSLR
jgi:predicted transcriptional regulator